VRHFIFFLLFVVFSVSTNAQGENRKHEVRAVWLATINGIDWPRTTHTAQQKRDLAATLDRLQQAGINTVLFQARVRATTMYPSRLEPWEGCLTGHPGQSPGYDPLQLCIDLCHERGMECHAWVVTIPVGKWNNLGCRQLRQRFPRLIQRIGEEGYMDPEQGLTGDYLTDVCSEITRNYDIDGIHLDYIRYPETWKIKVSRQRGRDYITSIVRKIRNAVKAQKPWVKLSCSPIGKYDDLGRYRAGGWNARTAVCQDAQLWLKAGLMDQLYPMMYFQGNNFYPFAIDWQENANGRMVIGGLGIYFLDPREGRWTLDVVEREMNVLRQIGMGQCFFRAKFLNDNVKGIYDFTSRFNAVPALVPPMTWYGQMPPKVPRNVNLKDNRLSWSREVDQGSGSYLLYNIYASEDFPVDITKAENLVAARLMKTEVKVPVGRMNFAVTAMNRYGQESAPSQVLVNAGPRYAVPPIVITNGRPVGLPKMSEMDVSYILIETIQGRPVALRRYAETVRVDGLPSGMYQIRAVGRKGRNHRIGFFCIKRK
jgi:uncharacterized lipoprotein YddW (UPF0748 family)